MIRILIVEDNQHKQENIKKAILDVSNIKEEEIKVTKSIKEAKKLLYDEYFDLMILDLVLPLEIGDDADAKHGAEFLDSIHSNPMIKPPIHIIGMSGFSDKVTEFKQRFQKRLWHLIEYSPDSVSWQDQLTNIIYHLVRTRERYITESLKKHYYDIAIITALPSPELEAILRLNNGNWEKFKVEDDITQYYKTKIQTANSNLSVIAATADQMGMTASSHLSTKMTLYFKPRYIIMAGIAAGIKDRGLGYGDILVAEQSWDYGSGKIIERTSPAGSSVVDIRFEPDTRDIQLSADLKAKITSFKLEQTSLLDTIQNEWPGEKPTSKLQVHLGPIGSGSYVISSEETLSSIKNQQRKLLGVEMETFGVYYAAGHSSNPETKAISIKSVSDFGDGSKNDKYQKYAAYTSSSFIYHFILKEL